MTALQSLEPGAHRLPCPACNRGPKDRNFSVNVQHGGAYVARCFRCEYVETFRPNRAAPGAGLTAHRPNNCAPGAQLTARPVAPLKRTVLSDYGHELYASCTGLRGTIGDQYRLARGCVLTPTMAT